MKIEKTKPPTKRDIECLFGHHNWQPHPKFPTLREYHIIWLNEECTHCKLLRHRLELIATYVGGMSNDWRYYIGEQEVSRKFYDKEQERQIRFLVTNYYQKEANKIGNRIEYWTPFPLKFFKLRKLATIISCISIPLCFVWVGSWGCHFLWPENAFTNVVHSHPFCICFTLICGISSYISWKYLKALKKYRK